MTAPTQKEWDQIHALREHGTPAQRAGAEAWASTVLILVAFREHNEAAWEKYRRDIAEINARHERRMEEVRHLRLRNERLLRRALAVVLVAIGAIVLVGWFGR